VSDIAGPTPLYGTCVTSIPVRNQVAADAGRRIVDLAGRGLCRRDVFGERLHRLRGVHHQHVRHRHHLRHRHEIAQHVIGQLLVDQMVDGDGAGAEQQRVAVGRRAHDRIDAQHVAGAAAVLDVELLAQHLAEMQREQPGGGVRGAARRGRHQDLHRLVRPVRLRLRVEARAHKSDRRDGKSKHDVLPFDWLARPAVRTSFYSA
jgi:hypothetical protein